MGVQYVLEGGVQKSDGQVRITSRLIDATTDHHSGRNSYDRPFTDLFTLQEESCRRSSTTLKLQLTAWRQGGSARKHTDNMEAYDNFLRGNGHFTVQLTRETILQARQM